MTALMVRLSIMLYGKAFIIGIHPELNGHEIGSYFEVRDKEFGLTVHEGSPALMINRNI